MMADRSLGLGPAFISAVVASSQELWRASTSQDDCFSIAKPVRPPASRWLSRIPNATPPPVVLLAATGPQSPPPQPPRPRLSRVQRDPPPRAPPPPPPPPPVPPHPRPPLEPPPPPRLHPQRVRLRDVRHVGHHHRALRP